MYLGNGVPVILRQTADAVGDVQLVLADDGSTRVAQQLVVMQQRARNSVFYRQHADGRRVLLDRSKDLLERRAADQLYLLTLEVQVCCNVVK